MLDLPPLVFNYMKTGFRSVYKNKLYSLINIIGLSIALTVSLSIFLYIESEMTHDNFHDSVDRITRHYLDLVSD